jgi:hypothetical protein
MSGNVKGRLIRDGLLIYYDPANTSSYLSGDTVVYDLSKNSRNGNLINNVGYSSVGLGSFSFDGVDDLISLPAITGLSDFTISMWFQSTGAGSTGFTIYNTLIGQGTGNRILVGTGSNKFVVAQMGGSDYVTTNTCSFNVWNNVTYTYDSVNNIAQFYVNNIKEASQSNASVTYTVSPHFLGSWSNPIAGYAMKGYISSFFMYNRKLSDDEVTNNYNTLRGRFGR